MPDSPTEDAETGGPDLISFADIPARLERAGLKRVSAQRCRQLAEDDPAWPIPLDKAMKVGRMRLFDWRVLEPYFRDRTSRQGQRTDLRPPAAE
ncbi:hypothetical protein PUR49_05400 [Streptomyces sp. BE147]|uniref:hypothetical protein n=1 Tax=Streptomyces sp. BE147 TaxID=3002524 RepID=UPI002E7A0257|nr:hypothetical protein [Streptomyces sp. BE147]MEE1735950.1 hypothetical protein [Streptomyces sp. BE147]